MTSPDRHIDTLFPEGVIDSDTLVNWYTYCQPGGSGPNNILRMLCATLEELAAHRKVELPPARGLLPPPKPKKVKSKPSELGLAVRGVIEKHAKNNTEVTNKKKFKDMGIDSLGKIEIMVDIELALGIELDGVTWEKFDCASDIIEHVKTISSAPNTEE